MISYDSYLFWKTIQLPPLMTFFWKSFLLPQLAQWGYETGWWEACNRQFHFSTHHVFSLSASEYLLGAGVGFLEPITGRRLAELQHRESVLCERMQKWFMEENSLVKAHNCIIPCL